MSNNTNTSVVRYVNSAKYPIRFDRLRPGSLFKITAEPSRGIRHSNDERVYRRALDHQGFYATNVQDEEQNAVLMPFDLVQPLRVERVK